MNKVSITFTLQHLSYSIWRIFSENSIEVGCDAVVCLRAVTHDKVVGSLLCVAHNDFFIMRLTLSQYACPLKALTAASVWYCWILKLNFILFTFLYGSNHIFVFFGLSIVKYIQHNTKSNICSVLNTTYISVFGYSISHDRRLKLDKKPS